LSGGNCCDLAGYTAAVRFELRLRDGIHEDRITLAFRRWKASQVVAGHHYRTGRDMVEAVSVDVVTPADVDDSQAAEAGYPGVAELLADLRGDEQAPLYRIRFRRLEHRDPRDELASRPARDEAEIAALSARLARMDKSASHGPWTTSVLRQIAENPGTVSTVLAETLGWERQDFKLHVRRLKELGLTISLEVGYRLSPRGEAYLAHVTGLQPSG
jgi:biotin operon repressor